MPASINLKGKKKKRKISPGPPRPSRSIFRHDFEWMRREDVAKITTHFFREAQHREQKVIQTDFDAAFHIIFIRRSKTDTEVSLRKWQYQNETHVDKVKANKSRNGRKRGNIVCVEMNTNRYRRDMDLSLYPTNNSCPEKRSSKGIEVQAKPVWQSQKVEETRSRSSEESLRSCCYQVRLEMILLCRH